MTAAAIQTQDTPTVLKMARMIYRGQKSEEEHVVNRAHKVHYEMAYK